MKESDATGIDRNGWIIIPSKTQDIENFEANVRKLQELSYNDWSTKGFWAELYLGEGEFHIYMNNGKPELGCRFIGDKVEEIQSIQKNFRILTRYYDIIKTHIIDYPLSDNVKQKVETLEHRKEYLKNFINKNFPNGVEQASTQEILEAFGIKCIKDSDGFYTISHYQAVHEYDVDNGTDSIIFSDLGVNENKLFKEIRVIEKNADFEYSNITSLGNLQSIGGNANFWGSNITSLGNLQSIGGNANFWDLEVTSLGNLQSIGGDANFGWSNITSLGNLQSIGGNTNFNNSKITSLEQLQYIGGSAYFCSSNITSLGKLQSIGGSANFGNLNITSLGNLQSIGGDVYFYHSNITSLGNLQSIGGKAYFEYSQIRNLDKLEYMSGYDIENLLVKDYKLLFKRIQPIIKQEIIQDFLNKTFPNGIKQASTQEILETLGMECEKNSNGLLIISHYHAMVDYDKHHITFFELGIDENKLFQEIEIIKEDANFNSSQLTDLGKLRYIGGNADFGYSNITSLGNLQYIGGIANFEYSQVQNLGQLKCMGGCQIEIFFLKNFKLSLDIFEPIKEKKIRKNFFYTIFPNGIKQLSTQEILEALGIKCEKDNEGLLTISHYNAIVEYERYKFTLFELGIDENKLFQDIKVIKNDANFNSSQLTDLGKLLAIGGNADFGYSQMTSLGNLEFIGGDVKFHTSFSIDSNIINLGKLQYIGGNVNFGYSQITSLDNLKYIRKNADFRDSQITDLGKLQYIDGSVDFRTPNITDLKNLQYIGGDVSIKETNLKKSDFNSIKIDGSIFTYRFLTH